MVRDELDEAIREETPVQFRYDKEGDGFAALRTFSPWEIKDYEYSTIVIGYDHDRDAIRGFDIDKITSEVEPYPNDHYHAASGAL